MSGHKIKLWEELDTNTEIEWWNDNRKRLNEAIRMANDWQINHRQDSYYASLVLAKVEAIVQWEINYNNHELSDWQIDLLQEIRDHVVEVMNSEGGLK